MDIVALLAAVIDGLARLFGRPAADAPGTIYDGPRPGAQGPHSRFGGRVWRYDETGVHADGILWRTPGEPVTCRAILDRHAGPILAAARRHGVNPALVVMTVAVETGGLRRDGFTGPRSFRWEAHVVNRDMAPPFSGTYSAGPMQILATTARDLIVTHGKPFGLRYDPFRIAPAYRAPPVPPPAQHPLYAAEANIDLGTAAIRRQLRLTGDADLSCTPPKQRRPLRRPRHIHWRLRSHGGPPRPRRPLVRSTPARCASAAFSRAVTSLPAGERSAP